MHSALRLFCVVALLTACGGSRKVGPDSESTGTTQEPSSTEPDGPRPATARLHLALEFELGKSKPPTTQVDLVETNETGSNARHDLGLFEGECKDVTKDVRVTDPKVFLAFHCTPFGEQRGVLVHILRSGGRLALLRAWLGTSKPTFDDFDQIGVLPPFASGVPLRTDYD